jgi:hypothetical protein
MAKVSAYCALFRRERQFVNASKLAIIVIAQLLGLCWG